jgi:hypothetical protein
MLPAGDHERDAADKSLHFFSFGQFDPIAPFADK